MQPRYALWYMITALLSVPLLPACARLRAREDNERIVRSKIEAEIARSLDATKRQDIQAFMDGFAPEFEVEATDGDQGTLGVLRANTLREWAIIPATLAISMRIDSLKTEGPRTAVVFTDQRWERLMLERDGVTRDTVVTTQRHREIWRRGTVGWRRSKVTELGGTVMVNGKPYP